MCRVDRLSVSSLVTTTATHHQGPRLYVKYMNLWARASALYDETLTVLGDAGTCQSRLTVEFSSRLARMSLEALIEPGDSANLWPLRAEN